MRRQKNKGFSVLKGIKNKFLPSSHPFPRLGTGRGLHARERGCSLEGLHDGKKGRLASALLEGREEGEGRPVES